MERLIAPSCANEIDVPPRQHRAKPRRECAAPVEVFEQRAPAVRRERCRRAADPVELCPERVGELLSRCVVSRHGSCRSVQNRSVRADHMFPGALIAGLTCGSQCKVIDVQCVDVRGES